MRMRANPALAAALGLLLVAACSGSEKEGAMPMTSESPAAERPPSRPTAPTEVAVIRVKDRGEIRIALAPDRAPQTVENFKKLASQGFYDGTTFHRVIPGFMIQGGDPNTKDRDPRNDGYGGPGYTIQDEINDIPHERGVISMANTGRPNTAGSQFFIVVKDATHLNGKYSAFGRVISGMDVVDQIVAVERDVYGRNGPRDRPLENVVVESIRVEPAPAG